MLETTQLIEKFYINFQQKNWKELQTCYHDKVIFSDPVFRNLEGAKAKAMWHNPPRCARRFSYGCAGSKLLFGPVGSRSTECGSHFP